MQLVPTARNTPDDLAQRTVGAALGVLFADKDELAHLRAGGAGVLPLSAGYSICAEDVYLVLPDDIGDEIVDIMRDGDGELLEEAMAEGLVAVGQIRWGVHGEATLHAQAVAPVATLLATLLPYASSISPWSEPDPLQHINSLPHLQCTMLSALLDAQGLATVIAQEQHLGTSWRAASTAPELPEVDSTYVWSRRTAPGEVGIELALFSEEDDLIALLRPLKLRLA